MNKITLRTLPFNNVIILIYMQTRSTLNSKWNSNKPTHSVLGDKLLVDRRGLGQNPMDALTGLEWTDLVSDTTLASP